MDAAPWRYANEATHSVVTIKDSLHSPLFPTIFDSSFIDLAGAERKRGECPPTALERARARWRYAQMAE
jgi:hypothetical protein